ncbi:MAG: arsenate reductase (glutaredoxin) [Candidatus Poribacteria bacterium]|nr:arsenate reductase (glutaredoxin) [Candidatus Poribacteria bacterium]
MSKSNEWTLYHNPQCSKSRGSIEYLAERNIEPTVIEYLRTPPDAATLSRIIDMLGIEPRDLLRTERDEYTASGLDKPNVSREKIIQAILKHPILMQRPVVIRGDKAVIGRPPELIASLL